MSAKAYLALDFPDWNSTEAFLRGNGLHGVPVKVGMELFYKEGPTVVEKLKELDHAVFLDLKLHDIPTTVMRAMRNIAGLGVDLVNVHALGGREMIEAAKQGLSGSSTKLIAVTILTSMDERVLQEELMINGRLEETAVRFARLAKVGGADGVVCSVHEAAGIKAACGESFLTVTPGIRLKESAGNDQKRIATPAFARKNGSDYIVIGRSVTNAKNPIRAYEQAIKEWENGIEA